MNNLYIINVDNSKFYLSENTISNYPNSSFHKCIVENQIDKRINIKHNNVFIDADEDSIKFIISYMRGYQDNLLFDDSKESLRLKNKVYHDAKYFKLTELQNLLESILDLKNEDNNNLYSEESMSLSVDDKYNSSSNNKVGGKISLESFSESEKLFHENNNTESDIESDELSIPPEENETMESLSNQFSVESEKEVDEDEDENLEYKQNSDREELVISKMNIYDDDGDLSDYQPLDLEEIIKFDDNEKKEFDDFIKKTFSRSKKNNDMTNETSSEMILGDNLGGNKDDINNLLYMVENNLVGGDMLSVINLISTDKNVNNLIKNHNQRYNQYNTDSEETNEENSEYVRNYLEGGYDIEENLTTSALETDLENLTDESIKKYFLNNKKAKSIRKSNNFKTNYVSI